MNQPKATYLKDYRPADFIIDTVHLHFDLYEDKALIKAILELRRNPQAKHPNAALVLDGDHDTLTLLSVSLDGHLLSPSQYQCDDQHLTIAEVPDQFILETEVETQPQNNMQLMGLFKSRGNFCTQCEARGFHRITYYLDRPDVMARFSTTISADAKKYPMLLSNGNLIAEKKLSDGRHWVHWEDPSLKPCYLFALVAGDFDLLQDQFVTMSGKTVDLRLYLEKGYRDQGDYALASLKQAMQWDEQAYGREYDLDIYMIVAVSDFNMGAMENKGLNIFNTKYILAKADTATDTDYIAIEGVIGHEYFHNWSGNRVTCRDWFQITLKEGLTVFRDQSFTADRTSQAVARIDVVDIIRNQQFTEDAGLMAHPIRPDSYIEINNFYTLTVYRKGAEVIRMVQTLLTPPVFRQAMGLYFSRYDGQAVTTEDFIKAMEDASGKDLTQFQRWYHQAGTPILEIESDYNAEQQALHLTVKQSCPSTPGQPHKQPFHLPLMVGLVNQDCNDCCLQLTGEPEGKQGSRLLEITESEQTFTFINLAEKPVPSLLRGFSAPVEVHYPYTNEELSWLMQCDSDAYCGWDAGQKLAVNIILELARCVQEGKKLELNQLMVDAHRSVLETRRQDLRYLAKLLRLPSLSYLVQQADSGDLDAIFTAFHFVKQKLALALEPLYQQVYHEYHHNNAYEFSMQEVGKRSVKNLALAYLAFTGKEEYLQLAQHQYQQANNMTDVMGALVALNEIDCRERTTALAVFYERWQKEALVVNKWLQLQASSTLKNTLMQVKDLLQHPAFDIHNPNNVYALLVAFGNNVMRFHDVTGAGYEFIADQVLTIDRDNPQVAARVLQPLTHWNKFDSARAQLMQKSLQRISKAQHLSKDIYEIVTKCLNF